MERRIPLMPSKTSQAPRIVLQTGASASAHVGFWGGTDRHLLADWRTASSQDAVSVAADPLFVDRDGPDNVLGFRASDNYDGARDDNFHLTGGSPAIDRGDGNVATPTDREGNPRVDDAGTPNAGTPATLNYVDLGAHELQGSSLDTTPPTVLASVIHLHGSPGNRSSEIHVTFSEPLDSIDARADANYELREAGPNGTFDNSDDVLVPLVPRYTAGSTEVTLDVIVAGGFLPHGNYRLTVRGTTSIHDMSGNRLDGDLNGTAGGDSIGTNQPPSLDAIGNRSATEASLLAFTVTATDPDGPASSLRFSLGEDAPAGASIDAVSGQFTWTPSTVQAGASHLITILVADAGSPRLVDHETITISVARINHAPVLDPIGDRTAREGRSFSVTVTASDPDNPNEPLTFSLDPGAPTGVIIEADSGLIRWAVTEADGPGVYPITVRVSDTGSPALSDTETFSITVTEQNSAPLIAQISDRTVAEGNLLSVQVIATDPDLPTQTLEFSLKPGAPDGASIDPVTGLFTWTPTEAHGPGQYTIAVRVTDSGSPAEITRQFFVITVTESNSPPQLDSVGPKSVDEQSLLTFTATATDPDLPANALTFSLDTGSPAGANITGSGVFSWTPTEAGDYSVTIRVRDNGNPAMDDSETITIHVNEVNAAPVLDAIGNQIVAEQTTLTITATATDANQPANTLTFSLDAGAPAGASITSDGIFSWTSAEADGPGDYVVTIRVRDSGSPALEDSETITIHVNEVNAAPVLAAIGDRTVDEQSTLTFSAVASDSDVPANTVTFSLAPGAPAGASITEAGVFSWTPAEGDGPGDYSVTIRARDNGSPMLQDSETITIHVNERNELPVLAAIGEQSVDFGSSVAFTATATDPDLPGNTLRFSLAPGSPAGASIDTTTGEFIWPASNIPGPGTYSVTVQVRDDGTPVGEDSETVVIRVRDSRPPTVTDVRLVLGRKSKVTSIVVTFSEAVLGADKLSNYRLTQLKGRTTRDLALSSASYDTLNHQATVIPTKPLSAKSLSKYTLTVRGSGTLTDVDGLRLDGDADGMASGDFVRRLSSDLIRPARQIMAYAAVDELLTTKEPRRTLSDEWLVEQLTELAMQGRVFGKSNVSILLQSLIAK